MSTPFFVQKENCYLPCYKENTTKRKEKSKKIIKIVCICKINIDIILFKC